MARPRKPKQTVAEKNPAIGSLLSALKFLEPISSDEGTASQTHCQINRKTAVMFNGTIARGCIVDIDTTANVHLKLLLAALNRCKEEVQITQISNALCVQSGKYKAFVPCLPDELFAPTMPAPQIAPCDDRLKASLAITGRVAVENGKHLFEAAILLRENSAIATDGKILFEHWHGISMPTMVFPKLSQVQLCKIEKKITGFGITWTEQKVSAVTIWFEDDSWFRTQLYVEDFPNTDKVFDQVASANLWPVPDGLWDGLEAVGDFITDKQSVFFDGKVIRTSDSENVGATIEIKGSLPKICVNHEYISMFAGLANMADFAASSDLCKFQGENFRGVLAKIKT